MDLYIVAHARDFQVEALERDAVEILRLVRLIKSSLAPINNIPPEVLSLIPDYSCEDYMDQDLIALTHVSRGWRDTFISRSSLWTRLDFMNIDKTRTYIQRSRSSPLKFSLRSTVIDAALPLMIPHIPRLKSLAIDAGIHSGVLHHLNCHIPLLEELDVSSLSDPVLNNPFFSRNLSSLRELHLGGTFTHFPWKNLANLQVIDLKSDSKVYKTTQILDLLMSAPLLHTVFLSYLMLNSDASRGRIVHLHNLKVFTLNVGSSHSNLLHHLRIPTGVSFTSKFHFYGKELRLSDLFPVKSPNFRSLSPITAVNLLFDRQYKFARLSGPNGSLRMLVMWKRWGEPFPYIRDGQLLRSFGHPMLSTIQRLTISKYGHSIPTKAEECPILRTLSFTNDLQILTLIDCNCLPFVFALDPSRNPSNFVPCPKMKEIVFYITSWNHIHLQNLTFTAKHRASRGAKVSSITFVDLGGRGEMKKVLGLEEHVTHVEYRVEGAGPVWDAVPGESVARVIGFGK